MSDFLIRSLVLSAALTVALNAFVMWRGRSAPRSLDPGHPPDPERPPDTDSVAGHGEHRPGVQIFFPWKAMLVISIALTVLLNLGALLVR